MRRWTRDQLLVLYPVVHSCSQLFIINLSACIGTLVAMTQTNARIATTSAAHPTNTSRHQLGAPIPSPRRRAPQLAALVVGAGLIWVLVLAASGETSAQLHAPGGPAIFAGTAFGLVGTYLALVMVLLVSRIPPVERVLGLDGLVHWHRRLSPWPISLIVAHAVLILVGYAQAAKTGIGAELRPLLFDYPDVLAATVGLLLMVAVGVASMGYIRRRLRRETWWVLHLYLYLALALSFAHAVVLGPTFVGHPITQAIWSVAWAASAGLVIVYRFGLPLLRSLRYQLRVADVRSEGPGVVSVILRGRRLDRLPVAGGQFVQWRFLTRGLWWQAHPYTLSALPRPPHLRITVKDVGDHSGALARLRPGTRVWIEGPYGAFTRQARCRGRVTLIGAGIGVTAIRSLLEDLPAGTDPVVVLRASTEGDLVLRHEVEVLVNRHRGTLHELVGSRHRVRVDAEELLRLIPDLDRRDVYVCGPERFVAQITDACRHLGVPRRALHHEAYAL